MPNHEPETIRYVLWQEFEAYQKESRQVNWKWAGAILAIAAFALALSHNNLQMDIDRNYATLIRVEGRLNGADFRVNTIEQTIGSGDGKREWLKEKATLSTSELAMLEDCTPRTILRKIKDGTYTATQSATGIWTIDNPYLVE